MVSKSDAKKGLILTGLGGESPNPVTSLGAGSDKGETTGGKPSTWLPPEGLVEQETIANKFPKEL